MPQQYLFSLALFLATSSNLIHAQYLFIQTNKHQVVDPSAPIFPRPDFFAGSLLNFAENFLYPPNISISPSDIAIIASTESSNREITWGELRSSVKSTSNALRKLGVKTNDRVAGFLGNHEKTVIAMLAATSIGAIWTGISPDTGVSAVLDRLVQIEPVSILKGIFWILENCTDDLCRLFCLRIMPWSIMVKSTKLGRKRRG
jgi:hypothetical protein